MKLRKNTIPIMLLVLLLVAFATGMAQTPAQSDQKTKTESCCAMTDDHDCCACCGDSCDMNMKHDATMKHDMNMKHDKDHKGDCCNMKNKDKNKDKTNKKAA